MTGLPAAITAHLLTAAGLERSPAYLQVEPDGSLTAWGGEVDRYGLEGLKLGQSVEQQVFFLAGLLPLDGPALFLPCVQAGHGLAADIHVFHRDGYDWVLLLDSTPLAVQGRLAQQQANELSLLHERQARATVQPGREMNDSLLSDLLATLGVAVLERTDAGTFRSQGRLPDWFLLVFPEAGATESFQPGSRFHFLEHFLAEAELFWKSGQSGRITSGPWHETGLLHGGQYLEASALRVGAHQVLLLESSPVSYGEKQFLIQIGREKSLDLAAREREKQILQKATDELGLAVNRNTSALSLSREETLREARQHQVAQEALRQSEEHLHRLVQLSPAGILIVDAGGRVRLVNPAMARMLNAATTESLLGQPFLEWIAQEERDHCTHCFHEVISIPERPVQTESELVKFTGEHVPVEIDAGYLRWQGEPAVQIILHDITRRRGVEAEMRLLAHSVESTSEMICVTDLEDRFTFVNQAFLDAYGYSRDEVLGQHARILWSPNNPSTVGQVILEDTRRGGWKGELLNLRKDGFEFPIALSTSQVRDQGGRVMGLIGVARDISERRRTEEALRRSEEQLRHAQKMEAVGKLAGGVAHDFNNVLTAVTGYSELALSRLAKDDPLRMDLEEIRKAGERAASMTRQLLAFSRKQILEPQIIDLNNVVIGMETLLRRLIGEDIELVAVTPSGLSSVKADPGQIERVILNLVLNARDAMPKGGKLTIETADVDLDETYAEAHSVTQGTYVMLAVSDTGRGIDKEIQPLIFEPFFTTKEEGQGTGLGLSTVYGIVTQSGGHVSFYSEPGYGTTFKVYLPRVPGRVVMDLPEKGGATSGGSETVLLVEDEDSIRRLAVTILRTNGYFVIEARDGREAVLLSSQHRGSIHLLLTDTVMPHMSGPDLVRLQTSLRPQMKVLYMSGYTDDAVVRHGVLEQSLPFLQKPFTPEILCRKVREVLDSSGSRDSSQEKASQGGAAGA